MTQEQVVDSTAQAVEPQASPDAAIDKLLEGLGTGESATGEEAPPASPAAEQEQPKPEAEAKPEEPVTEEQPEEIPHPLLDRVPAAKAVLDGLAPEQRAAINEYIAEREAAVQIEETEWVAQENARLQSFIQHADTTTKTINSFFMGVRQAINAGAVDPNQLAQFLSQEGKDVLNAWRPTVIAAEVHKKLGDTQDALRLDGFEEAAKYFAQEATRELDLPPTARKELKDLVSTPVEEGKGPERLNSIAKAIWQSGRKSGLNDSGDVAELEKKVEDRAGQGPAPSSGTSGRSADPEAVLSSPLSSGEDKRRAFESKYGIPLEV